MGVFLQIGNSVILPQIIDCPPVDCCLYFVLVAKSDDAGLLFCALTGWSGNFKDVREAYGLQAEEFGDVHGSVNFFACAIIVTR